MSLSQPQNDNFNYWIYHFMQLSFVYTTPLFCIHLYMLLIVLFVLYIKKIRTISDDFQPPTVMLYAFSPEYHTVRWDRISLHYVLVCWLDCNIHLKFDEKVKPLAVWIA